MEKDTIKEKRHREDRRGEMRRARRGDRRRKRK
jgi:hypothetical protein